MGLREFQGYEFGWLCFDVGDCWKTVGHPSHFAGLEAFGPGCLAFDRGAQVDVGNGYQQERAGVMVRGDCGSGLEFEFGGSDCVFYEEDLLGASRESFQGSVFVLVGIPLGGGVAEVFVVYDFYGHVAEGLVGSIVGYVGEGGGREVRFAVLELDGGGRFVFDLVDYLGWAQSYIDVVVAVPVH